MTEQQLLKEIEAKKLVCPLCSKAAVRPTHELNVSKRPDERHIMTRCPHCKAENVLVRRVVPDEANNTPAHVG